MHNLQNRLVKIESYTIGKLYNDDDGLGFIQQNYCNLLNEHGTRQMKLRSAAQCDYRGFLSRYKCILIHNQY